MRSVFDHQEQVKLHSEDAPMQEGIIVAIKSSVDCFL